MTTLNNKIQLKILISKKLDLLGLSFLEQEKIISGLLENISVKVNIAIEKILNQEEQAELQAIALKKDKDALMGYLKSKISNVEEIVEEIAQETIEEFKAIRNNKI